jgi:hypothetical protein
LGGTLGVVALLCRTVACSSICYRNFTGIPTATAEHVCAPHLHQAASSMASSIARETPRAGRRGRANCRLENSSSIGHLIESISQLEYVTRYQCAVALSVPSVRVTIPPARRADLVVEKARSSTRNPSGWRPLNHHHLILLIRQLQLHHRINMATRRYSALAT